METIEWEREQRYAWADPELINPILYCNDVPLKLISNQNENG